MAQPWEGRSATAIGQRMLLTREALRLQQNEFAQIAGMLPNHLSEVEAGNKGIGIDKVRALKDAFGITLDWVYDGDMDGLPLKLANTIRALQSVPALAKPRPHLRPV